MKNYRTLFILGILITIVITIGLKINCNSNKNTTNDNIQEIELREFFHKEITKDLTKLTDGYVTSANQKFGENTKLLGENTELLSMTSTIQLSKYDNFDMIRMLINSYVRNRNDIKVMEPWTLQSNSNCYNLSLTSELVFAILICYYNDTFKIKIITTLNQ